MTTNGVAAIAGVAVGGVHAYFPNKESIVAELIRRTLRAGVAEIEAVFEHAAKIEGREQAIDFLVRGCARVASRHRSLLRVFFEQVPFYREMEEVKTLPMSLFSIAWRSRPSPRWASWRTTYAPAPTCTC